MWGRGARGSRASCSPAHTSPPSLDSIGMGQMGPHRSSGSRLRLELAESKRLGFKSQFLQVLAA